MLLWVITLLSLASSVTVCALAGAFAGYFWLLWLPLGFVATFVVLLLLSFLFLCICCAFVDLKKPQEKDSRFFRHLTGVITQTLVTLLRVHIHATGLEKTPKEGRFLLVCNHTSDADPVVLLHCFQNSQLAFLTKRENYSMFLVGKVMHKLMCQPVNRENDREALKTIIKCIQMIREDQVSVAVFPEGYIHKDRKLHHFRHGAFKIAMKTKVPIVVCTLTNTLQIFKNMPKLKPTDVDLHLLTVIQPEEYAGLTTVELGTRVYEMMAADLGPEHISDTPWEI